MRARVRPISIGGAICSSMFIFSVCKYGLNFMAQKQILLYMLFGSRAKCLEFLNPKFS